MNKWHLPMVPFEVQLEAIKRSGGKKCWGHFLEMGLGKTAVTCHEFIDLCIEGKVDILIIICPNTLKRDWQEKIVSEYNMNVKTYVWPEVPRSIDTYKKIQEPIAIFVNFEGVAVSDGEDFIKELSKIRKIMLVVDESIQIKSPTALRSKAILRIGNLPGVKVKRLLTGLPSDKGPHELWTQLTFLEAIPGFKFHAFKHTFCIMGGFRNKQIIGTQNENMLHGILDTCSWRAKKQDWLKDLPQKLYSLREIQMSKEQEERYYEIDRDLYAYFAEENQEVEIKVILTKLTKLRQILSGFIITDEGKVIELNNSRGRLKETANIVEESGKAIVFAGYNYSIEMLLDELKKYNPVTIRGRQYTDEEQVSEAKRKFNRDKDCKVMVAQIDAVKYGHTMVGSKSGNFCGTAIYYENSFSLDTRYQSEDRIHRIGQTLDSVLYIDFISGPLDRLVIEALQKKKNISSLIIDRVRLS